MRLLVLLVVFVSVPVLFTFVALGGRWRLVWQFWRIWLFVLGGFLAAGALLGLLVSGA